MLVNQAIHALDTALRILPAECCPVAVSCQLHTLRPELAIEDAATAELRFSSGFSLFLTATTALPGHNAQHVRVALADETVVLTGTERPAMVRVPRASNDGSLAQKLAEVEQVANRFEHAHVPMIHDIVCAIETGTPTRGGLELEACKLVHHVVFALYESSRRAGEQVDIHGSLR